MLGLRTHIPHMVFAQDLRAAHLLTAPAEDSIIRIIPPLIIDESHVEEALEILHDVCASSQIPKLKSGLIK